MIWHEYSGRVEEEAGALTCGKTEPAQNLAKSVSAQSQVGGQVWGPSPGGEGGGGWSPLG